MKKKDDIRELLGRIRKLQNENHQIGLTSSKDVKKLLNENRNFLLKEENSDIQNVTPDEQREEESNFKGTVSKLVKFTPIKVYKQNVEWSGELIREKIKWVFSLNENNGCYISIESEDMTAVDDTEINIDELMAELAELGGVEETINQVVFGMMYSRHIITCTME